MSKKIMKLVNEYTSLMKCKVCGAEHYGMLKEGGKFHRGAWQCRYGCKVPKQNN